MGMSWSCTSLLLDKHRLTFLSIRPAGGTFTVEIADNRAQTSLSYNGKYTSAWANGKNYPDTLVRCILFVVLATQVDLP